jgi:hypothetical protein
MDDLVKQAMAKWPNVPDCYGWLGLDERGHWYLRDDAAQACGSFQSGLAGAKGSLLKHDKLIEFIHRNYAPDASGAWFFQNGPQRVYVELALTPLVWRLSAAFELTSQTGQVAEILACCTDAQGRVYFNTPMGFGLLHTLDVGQAAEGLEQGLWPLETVNAEALQTLFAYRISPAADYFFSSAAGAGAGASGSLNLPPAAEVM